VKNKKFKRAHSKFKTKFKIAELTPSPFPLPHGERSSIYCFFLSPVGKGVLFIVSSSPPWGED